MGTKISLVSSKLVVAYKEIKLFAFYPNYNHKKLKSFFYESTLEV